MNIIVVATSDDDAIYILFRTPIPIRINIFEMGECLHYVLLRLIVLCLNVGVWFYRLILGDRVHTNP